MSAAPPVAKASFTRVESRSGVVTTASLDTSGAKPACAWIIGGGAWLEEAPLEKRDAARYRPLPLRREAGGHTARARATSSSAPREWPVRRRRAPYTGSPGSPGRGLRRAAPPCPAAPERSPGATHRSDPRRDTD